jgi:hypothetical protein
LLEDLSTPSSDTVCPAGKATENKVMYVGTDKCSAVIEACMLVQNKTIIKRN